MLEYFALFLIFFVFLVLFYGIIIVHDIPYEIAAKRNHPQKEAIHYAGWVSLLTLHVIWPFLWIWATLRYPEEENKAESAGPSNEDLQRQVSQLQEELAGLKQTITENTKGGDA